MTRRRRCDGCGEPLTGRKTRWCGDRCRSRARRVEPENPVEAPTAFGPNRAAVEKLTQELDEQGLVSRLDSALLTAARELASQVDADPAASPLWGRFQTALESLRQESSRAVNEVETETLWQVRTGCHVLEHAHGPALVHCGVCCKDGTGHVGIGRWIYTDDGHPAVWVPSDEELRARAASGEPVVLAS